MKITSPQALATALKDYRKRHHWSQKHVADLVGIKQTTVSAFESHPEKAKIETMFKILASLGLELQTAERGKATNKGWTEEW